MYTNYFGLNEKPFTITPDPRFLYLSERHAEALAHLQYGVMESGGFIQLTGEIGTGKTMVTRSLLARLPDDIEVAAILNPRVTVGEFLTTICEEFGLAPPDTNGELKALVDLLNAHLLECHAQGRRAVLVIDEAQNLDRDVLEQVRLLTNLETETTKLLQIILVGQPELRETLARNDLRQLAQRITGRYHLDRLTLAETTAYIRHRLQVAGGSPLLFTPLAVWEIHRRAGGVPRLINFICDRGLLGAYTEEKARVGWRLVTRATSEIQGRPPYANAARLAAFAVIALTLVGSLIAWQIDRPRETPPVADATAAPDDTAQSAASTLSQPTLTLEPRLATSGRDPARQQPQTAAAEPSVGALLRESAPLTGTDEAFAVLFELWGGQRRVDAGPPCQQASSQGLKCEHQLGSWTRLRAMDRPAILALVDVDGTEHNAVITAIGDDGADLRIGGDTHRIALADIADYWFGEYLMLWRPHAGADRLMLPGQRGAGIAWLRESLLSLSGGEFVGGDAALYDASLEALVSDFQRQARLRVDGKAGLQTLVALNSVLATEPTPRLSD